MTTVMEFKRTLTGMIDSTEMTWKEKAMFLFQFVDGWDGDLLAMCKSLVVNYDFDINLLNDDLREAIQDELNEDAEESWADTRATFID